MPVITSATDLDVAIVGAGPYGLSASAYLDAAGFHVRAFGEPMAFWAQTMPEGMLLRSPRVASTIADPSAKLTLESYEAASSIPSAAPLPLSTFVDYGRWFETRLAARVEQTTVRSVKRTGSGFSLLLSDANTVRCATVIVAAGVGPFRIKPPTFSHLPTDCMSHCYEGRPIGEFAGKRVAVIGAGQSALESAALLHERGAEVEVIARIPKLRWIGVHPRLHRMGPVSAMLYSKHDVGPIGISRLIAYPNLVARIPLAYRDRIRKRAVRSAGSNWLPARLAQVTILTGRSVVRATHSQGEVRLALDDGTERRVDHVLLGTGYRVDVSRYDFLPAALLSDVEQLDGSPVLTRGFASSVPGLHFIGAPAARSFGPLLYFVTGTEFASSELRWFFERQR
jgi:lysine/ornithine N-monooxygenase